LTGALDGGRLVGVTNMMNQEFNMHKKNESGYRQMALGEYKAVKSTMCAFLAAMRG
jgi:hypothetical protein